MADDENRSHVGPRGAAPPSEAGGGSPSKAINMALAELQAELTEPEAPATATATATAPPSRSASGPAAASTTAAASPATGGRVEHERPDAAERRTPPRDRDLSLPKIGVTPEPEFGGVPPLGRLLMSTLLPLLFGVLGAWGYLHFFGPPSHPADATAAPRNGDGADVAGGIPARSDSKDPLKFQVETLAQRVDQLAKRTETGARPDSSAEVATLQGHVDELTKTVGEFAPLPKKVEAIDQRLGGFDKTLGSIRSDLGDLKTKIEKVAAAAAAIPSFPGDSERRDPARPVLMESPSVSSGGTPASTGGGGNIEEAIAQGADLFKQQKYKEAVAVFEKLEKNHPDDARVWYFLALSRGFATNQWEGETERLAEKGVERERAGSPRTPLIDALFRDLTAANGKDWLAFFRSRVK